MQVIRLRGGGASREQQISPLRCEMTTKTDWWGPSAIASAKASAGNGEVPTMAKP
jgi:hypothetical protein